MRLLFLIAVFVCLSVHCIATGGNEVTGGLNSSTPTNRQEFLRLPQNFAADIDAWERAAIDILEKEEADDDRALRFSAIHILRRLRSKKAINALVVSIMLKPRYVTPQEAQQPDLGDIYPAAYALVQIGRPSVDACLRALKKAKGQEGKNLVWVIKQIEGEDAAQRLITGLSRE